MDAILGTRLQMGEPTMDGDEPTLRLLGLPLQGLYATLSIILLSTDASL